MTDLESIVESARTQGRCIAFLYRREGELVSRARVVMPVRIEAGLLLADDLHRRAPRSFIVEKIEVAQLGEKIEDIGPFESGPPIVENVGGD